jgi:hypothetical protein
MTVWVMKRPEPLSGETVFIPRSRGSRAGTTLRAGYLVESVQSKGGEAG